MSLTVAGITIGMLKTVLKKGAVFTLKRVSKPKFSEEYVSVYCIGYKHKNAGCYVMHI